MIVRVLPSADFLLSPCPGELLREVGLPFAELPLVLYACFEDATGSGEVRLVEADWRLFLDAAPEENDEWPDE